MLLTIVLVFEIVSLATSIVTFATAHCIVVNHCVECLMSCYLNKLFGIYTPFLKASVVEHLYNQQGFG